MQLQLTHTAPLLVTGTDVLTPTELHEVQSRLGNRHWLAQQGVSVRLDETGQSCELRDDVLPALTRTRDRLGRTLGLTQGRAPSIRIRQYGIGNAHSAHTDHY